MTDKLFFKASESRDSLISNRKTAFKKGYRTGFRCLDEIASFLTGFQTLVFAPPHVGKSSITLDILVAQAEMGRNTIIYSPEYRTQEEVVNALIQTKLSKSLFGKYADTITDEEFINALEFVDKHFVVIVKPKRTKEGVQKKMTVKGIFSEVKKAMDYYDTKFDFLFVDPANYIDKGEDDKFTDLATFTLRMFDEIAEYSQLMGLHTILSAHTRDVELVKDKDTGISYYPILHPSDVAGGQSNFRAGYQILHYHRAPAGVADRNGVPYPENYNIIYCQKSKPYGIGKISNTAEAIAGVDGLYFDVDKYVMYELINNKRYYRNEWYKEQEGESVQNSNPSTAIQPNLNFDDDDDIF